MGGISSSVEPLQLNELLCLVWNLSKPSSHLVKVLADLSEQHCHGDMHRQEDDDTDGQLSSKSQLSVDKQMHRQIKTFQQYILFPWNFVD